MEYIQNDAEHSDRLSHINTHKHLKSPSSFLLYWGNVDILVMRVACQDESVSTDRHLCPFEVRRKSFAGLQ
jgi:hypothetical protein